MPWSFGWFTFAVVALALWGVSGMTQKLATNSISSKLSFLWFAYAMLALAILLALTSPIRLHVGRLVFWLSVVGGALNGLGAFTSFVALKSGGKASAVISLISLFPLVTVTATVIFLHERLTMKQGLGILFALVAAILLSMEPDRKSDLPQAGQ
jgi:bacterial/archaeal transporter family protein